MSWAPPCKRCEFDATRLVWLCDIHWWRGIRYLLGYAVADECEAGRVPRSREGYKSKRNLEAAQRPHAPGGTSTPEARAKVSASLKAYWARRRADEARSKETSPAPDSGNRDEGTAVVGRSA